jgi:hypothetical protein
MSTLARYRPIASLLFLSATICGHAQVVELIVNGSFEDLGPDSSFPNNWFGSDLGAFNITTEPHLDGNFSFGIGTVGAVGGIYQDVPTVPGESYAISLWVTGQGDSSGEVVVIFGDTVIYSASQPDYPGWFQITGNSIASSSSTQLSILGRHDPSYYYFDSVSVQGVSAVPEPAEYGAVGGLITLAGGWLIRRSKSRTV